MLHLQGRMLVQGPLFTIGFHQQKPSPVLHRQGRMLVKGPLFTIGFHQQKPRPDFVVKNSTLSESVSDSMSVVSTSNLDLCPYFRFEAMSCLKCFVTPNPYPPPSPIRGCIHWIRSKCVIKMCDSHAGRVQMRINYTIVFFWNARLKTRLRNGSGKGKISYRPLCAMCRDKQDGSTTRQNSL